MLYFIIAPIVAGAVMYVLPPFIRKIAIIAVQMGLLALCAMLFYEVNLAGEVVYVTGAQNALLGIALKANGYTAALITLTVFLFLVSFLYTMREKFFDGRFAMLFFVLQGLLSGVFLSDDLFNIFVLLEVATVVVAILIMFKKDATSVYDAAMYLFCQIVCMFFYLFGIGYLYKIFGVLSISHIREMMHLADSSQLVLPFVFIMTAICLKSAFFPLFSWLPRAHGTPSAPTGVSAILSGLYVKNGIYLFFVFTGLFYPYIDMTEFFKILGTVTAVVGFVLAIIQTDIKLILAYHTVSQLGLIAMALSMGDTSQMGGLYHIINHALFKSLLFLTTGMIIKSYGTRDIREIRGVFARMPIVGIAVIVGVLGITGAPPLNGSISKYFMQYGSKGTVYEWLFILINLGTIISFVKYSRVLFGNSGVREKRDAFKNIAIVALSVLCVVFGVAGTLVMQGIFGVDVHIEIASYLEKTIVYAVSLTAGILIYRYVLSKNSFIYKFNVLTMNFLQVTVAMVVFFLTLGVFSL